KAKSAKRPKVVKPRPGSKVVPVRTKADKARLAQKENFVQVSLPKSLASMTEEEIMQWAKGLYKSVVEQLQPAQTELKKAETTPTAPKKQLISLVKVPSLKEMTDEERREWSAQLHAKLVLKLGAEKPNEIIEPTD
ncbi:MAG: hypothetical protein NTW81_06745, partial [Actinobacteria bacterium]|nr:hypothetical protein [Actinomycetota bacterium]